MRILIGAGMLGLAVSLVGPTMDQARGDEDGGYSKAQILLFRTPHLDGVDRPATLDYEYRREQKGGDGFVDSVALTVTDVAADGAKDISVHFLTGSRHKPYSDFTDFRGNPLLMVFLEDDVRRMAEKFGGGDIYMRNRIRSAFYDGASTEPVSFRLDGRSVAGTKVTVTPFVGGKYRERMGEYEHKVYEFVVSTEVPGGIYQMHSYVPSSSMADKPLIEDTLTYRGGEL